MDSKSALSWMAKPSAFVPVAMSLAAFGLVIADLALFGIQRQPDEGAAAHVWQLLMAGQIPIILFFVLKWLPRSPGPAVLTLGLQIATAILALAPVYWLRL